MLTISISVPFLDRVPVGPSEAQLTTIAWLMYSKRISFFFFFFFLHRVHWKRHSCPQKQLGRIICCSSMPPAFHFNFPPWFYHESSFQAQFPLILHLTFFFHSPHPHPKRPLWWQACAMCQWDEMKSGNSTTQNTHTHAHEYTQMLCAKASVLTISVYWQGCSLLQEHRVSGREWLILLNTEYMHKTHTPPHTQGIYHFEYKITQFNDTNKDTFQIGKWQHVNIMQGLLSGCVCVCCVCEGR